MDKARCRMFPACHGVTSQNRHAEGGVPCGAGGAGGLLEWGGLILLLMALLQ